MASRVHGVITAAGALTTVLLAALTGSAVQAPHAVTAGQVAPAAARRPRAPGYAARLASVVAADRRVSVLLWRDTAASPVAFTSPSADSDAWSQVKVLTAAALLADAGSPTMLSPEEVDWIGAALSVSDNDAETAMLAALDARTGDARAALDAVLVAAGDPHPPFAGSDAPVGLVSWSPMSRALLMKHLVTDRRPASAWLLEQMSHVVDYQRWGLGAAGAATFKGGWGNSDDGGASVHQFGALTLADGHRAVVVLDTLAPDFATGFDRLSAAAARIASLPAS